MHRRQTAPGVEGLADGAKNHSDEVVELVVQGGGIEFVAFETQARQRRRPGGLARAGPPEAQDGPAARRHVPPQPAAGAEAVREIEDGGEGDSLVRRHRGKVRRGGQERFDAGARGIGRPKIERFFVAVGDTGLALWGGHGEHGDVLIKFPPLPGQGGRERRQAKKRSARRRPGQGGVEMAGSGRGSHAGHDILHGMFHRHPGSAGAAPTRARPERDLQSELIGLVHGLPEQSLPGGTHERHGPAGNPEADFQENRAADARDLHRLQVGRHALAVEVAVHEIPINPRPGRVGRSSKILLKRGRSCA